MVVDCDLFGTPCGAPARPQGGQGWTRNPPSSWSGRPWRTGAVRTPSVRGIATLVIEKGFDRDNSTRGDFLHPPTLRFLEPWGVLAALYRDGALPIYHLAVSHRTLGRLGHLRRPHPGRGSRQPHGRRAARSHRGGDEGVCRRLAERHHGERDGDRAAPRGRPRGRRRRPRGGRRGARVPRPPGRRLRWRPVAGAPGAGIETARQPYDHYFVYIQADGPTDPPAAIHFCLDETGGC